MSDNLTPQDAAPTGTPPPAPQKVGEQLRKAREARGVTAESIARSLKLAPRIVESLESGRWSDFSAPPYIRVYLRAVGRYLGLDSAALIKLYESETGAASEPTTQELTKVSMKNDKQAELPTPWLAILGLLVALAVIGYVANRLNPSPHKPAAGAAVDTTQNAAGPHSAPQAPVIADSTADTSSAVDSTAADSATAPDTQAHAPAPKPALTKHADTRTKAGAAKPATPAATTKPLAASASGKPADTTKAHPTPAIAKPPDSAKAQPAPANGKPVDTSKAQPATPPAKPVPTGAAEPAKKGGTLKLVINAVKDSVWIQVYSDGKSTRSFVHAGRPWAFRAKDSLIVHVGQNANLVYTLNDKPYKPSEIEGAAIFRVDHSGTALLTIEQWKAVSASRQ